MALSTASARAVVLCAVVLCAVALCAVVLCAVALRTIFVRDVVPYTVLVRAALIRAAAALIPVASSVMCGILVQKTKMSDFQVDFSLGRETAVIGLGYPLGVLIKGN